MKTDHKKAYDELAVSAELHEKIIGIAENKKNISAGSVIFKAAAAAVSLFMLVFSTDMISYAVTGEGIAERMQKAASPPAVKSVEINGKKIEDFKVCEDGRSIEFYDPLYGYMGVVIDGTEEKIIIDHPPVFYVTKIDDRLIAIVGDDYLNIDITEKMENGSAEGEFEAEGKTYHYSVFTIHEDFRTSIYDDGYRWNVYEVK